MYVFLTRALYLKTVASLCLYLLANRPMHTIHRALGFTKHAMIQQILDVPQRSVVRALGHARTFADGELALKQCSRRCLRPARPYNIEFTQYIE
jgi:hypothetical protein